MKAILWSEKNGFEVLKITKKDLNGRNFGRGRYLVAIAPNTAKVIAERERVLIVKEFGYSGIRGGFAIYKVLHGQRRFD